MIIPDPINPDDVAIDEEGELLSPVRWLPIDPSGRPPTVADFDQAPVLGWSKGIPEETADA